VPYAEPSVLLELSKATVSRGGFDAYRIQNGESLQNHSWPFPGVSSDTTIVLSIGA
jgi:hypothetical protein